MSLGREFCRDLGRCKSGGHVFPRDSGAAAPQYLDHQRICRRISVRQTIREQIHATLDAKSVQAYAIYAEYLDLGHFTGPNYESIFETYFTNKYRDKPISLIVALGSEALNFSLRLRAKFGQTRPSFL